MNLQRGLLRVWAIGSAAWLVGWTCYIWATCNRFELGDYALFCLSGFSGVRTRLEFFSFWDYANVFMMGAIVPIAALILGVGVRWIIKGFRRI
jgi:hypothetical protein